MKEELQTCLDLVMERISYFGFIAESAPFSYFNQDTQEECHSVSVSFYHPDKVQLSGLILLYSHQGAILGSLHPFKILGEFEDVFGALWLGLKMWKEYGVNTKVSEVGVNTFGGESE